MSFVRAGARSGQADLISQAIGNPHFLAPWYPVELRIRIRGPLLKEPIAISRWYFEDKVAVDFEPDPLDERFYVDEKRAWCLEQGYAYVPVYLSDRLTLDDFAVRLTEARADLTADHRSLMDRRALDAATGESVLRAQPDVLRYVEQEAARRVEDAIKAGKNWRGASRQKKLGKIARELVAEILEKYPDGHVGPEYRTPELAHAAGR